MMSMDSLSVCPSTYIYQTTHDTSTRLHMYEMNLPYAILPMPCMYMSGSLVPKPLPSNEDPSLRIVLEQENLIHEIM